MNSYPRWDVLAATITASMRDVNMRQADLVRESGLSIPTIRAFMSGRMRSDHPTEYTIRRLEEGLMWPAGAVERILAGQDPQRVLEVQAEVIPIGGNPARELSPELLAELDERYVMLEDAQLARSNFAALTVAVKEMRELQDELRGRLQLLEEAEDRRRQRRRSQPASGG